MRLSSGDHLRGARVRRQWSREHVARELGVDEALVGRWERGEAAPTPDQVVRIVDLFDRALTEGP
ncbi:MAG: helix-turn-helix transcriptional regulator [Myxococcota bacterium]